MENPEEAAELIKELILEDLDNFYVVANAFGLEERERSGDYYEWHDEEGNSIDYYVNASIDGE